MSETGKTLVDQQEKFYEEPEYAYGVKDGDEDGNIFSDEEVSEDGESIQTRIEQISMLKMESMSGGQPRLEEMIRVRQLTELLHLEMAMHNLDMKPMPCVSQVTIKRIKDTKVVISNPTVYKVPNSDTYVILGNDAQIENLSSLLQQAMVRRNASNDVAESESESDESGSDEDDVDESESDDVDESGSEEDDVDERGSEEEDDVDESWYENLSWSEQADIKLVTNLTGVSKRKAANALKEFDGDIVTAIMELDSN
ncbi:hypothetical protein ABFX02_10G150900 [Erythranthe guttata]